MRSIVKLIQKELEYYDQVLVPTTFFKLKRI